VQGSFVLLVQAEHGTQNLEQFCSGDLVGFVSSLVKQQQQEQQQG
jgi:hypothetical protein